jgi:hypothetical protein
MKALSLWQPYASLAVLGYKLYETRPMPPPSTLPVGTRFAIVSTKQVKREQIEAANHPRMTRALRFAKIDDWKQLPNGFILGTVELTGFFQIDDEVVAALEEPQYVFGDWRPGRWAWALGSPRYLAVPVPVRGQQGLWEHRDSLDEA